MAIDWWLLARRLPCRPLKRNQHQALHAHALGDTSEKPAILGLLRASAQKAETGKVLLRATRTAGVNASRSSKVK